MIGDFEVVVRAERVEKVEKVWIVNVSTFATYKSIDTKRQTQEFDPQ